MRSVGIIDSFGPTGGKATPLEAAEVVAPPGGELLMETDRGTATAYLLRPGGTAYSSLEIVKLKDQTWRVEQLEHCAGESPLGKQRPRATPPRSPYPETSVATKPSTK